jgi:LCP family protein required for cell wall assembly
MFDQLDDPAGFRPTDAFRGGVRRRTRQLHRRRRARRLAAAAVLPTLAVVGVAVGLERRLDGVQRVDIGDRGVDPLDTGAPVTILVLGTDAAPHDPARAQVHTVQTDVVVVARIDAKGRVATLSIPRDLWTGTRRIDQMSRTELVAWLGADLGIHVDHLVSMDMEGFARLADQVRPRVEVRRPIRDRNSGLHLDAGCHELDGDEALAYVRARHLQELREDGTWVVDASGTVGRSVRTQSLAVAIWSRLHRLGAADVPSLVDTLARHGTVDAGLSSRELVELARQIVGAPAAPRTSVLGIVPAPNISTDVRRGETEPPPFSLSTFGNDDDASRSALASVGGRLAPSAPLRPLGTTTWAAVPLGTVTPC